MAKENYWLFIRNSIYLPTPFCCTLVYLMGLCLLCATGPLSCSSLNLGLGELCTSLKEVGTQQGRHWSGVPFPVDTAGLHDWPSKKRYSGKLLTNRKKHRLRYHVTVWQRPNFWDWLCHLDPGPVCSSLELQFYSLYFTEMKTMKTLVTHPFKTLLVTFKI